MAIIKNMDGTHRLKKVVPNKIPIREKWQQYKKRVAHRLNEKTKDWERKQQKRFLILFCTGFMALLILSFCFLTELYYESKPVTIPTLPKKILLTEQQVPKILRTPDPKKILPPLLDSVARTNNNIHSH